MSPSTLRRMPYFTALPPPEHVEVGGEVSYRYVRQDSELWGALHGGRLTTARLKDALGLRDATAARLGVGGPQVRVSELCPCYLIHSVHTGGYPNALWLWGVTAARLDVGGPPVWGTMWVGNRGWLTCTYVAKHAIVTAYRR